MWRGILSVVMSALVSLPLQSAQMPKPTVQEQLGQIGVGSIVEVKTRIKGMKKVRGRLGSVTAEGFEVQVAQGAKIDSVRLNFADVKSVTEKPRAKGMHPAVPILVGVGAGLLVIMIVWTIIMRGS